MKIKPTIIYYENMLFKKLLTFSLLCLNWISLTVYAGDTDIQHSTGLRMHYAGLGATVEYPINEKYNLYGSVSKEELENIGFSVDEASDITLSLGYLF